MIEKRKKSPFVLRGNKIHFISLGCPRNLVDTEVMIGTLLKAGYVVILRAAKRGVRSEFLEKYQLDNIGIFKYSQEPGSASFDYCGQIAEELKEKRYLQLMEKQQTIVKKNLKRYLNKTIECIVEGYHPETKYLMVARHKGQCPEIDGQVLINDTSDKFWKAISCKNH